MEVNCVARLSPKTEWRYVGLVASILLGDKPRKHVERNDRSVWWAESENYKEKANPSGSIEYVYIEVPLNPDNPVAREIIESDTDGKCGVYSMWYGLERKSLYPRASAAKIALTVALVKFFGGSVTYRQDSRSRYRSGRNIFYSSICYASCGV